MSIDNITKNCTFTDSTEIVSFEQYLVPIIRERIKSNIEQLLEDCAYNSLDLLKKIDKYVIKFGFVFADYSPDEIREKILRKIENDKLFQLFFIKEFSRQNFYEIQQQKYLLNIKNIKLVKLPVCGPESIYIDNGNLLYGSENRTLTSTKSIDFVRKTDTFLEYICAKYTRSFGGSQDNQYKDVKHYIIESCKYRENNPQSNINFVALLDGFYYTNKKYGELKQLIGIFHKNVYILSCDTYV